jgi:carnosine N-methyltransferase
MGAGAALTGAAQEERTVRTTYTSNARSMLRYEYEAAFWTATKVL